MELTEIVHGKEGLQSALRITDALFKGNIADLTADEISQAFNRCFTTGQSMFK